MKRVFAHLGFSAAVMLLILNFFSVTFAYIALGVVLAALCLVLSVPRLRQGVSVWLCLVGAVVACVTFIVGVHAAYLPQQKLVGQTAQVQFYVTDVRRGAEKNYYTVKTTAIDLPGVPQNIRSTFSAHADLGDVPDGIYTGKVTFASTGENGYAAWGKFSDGEFLSGKAARVRKTNQSAPGSAVALIQMRHAISSRFAAVLPGDRGALATALITGSKTNLSVGAVSHFRTCGSTHLMAVSGLHLSVIVGSLYWLLRKLRLPAWLTTVLTGAVLLVYDGVAGFSASVVRASLMMAVLLAARLFGRKADGLNSLGLAVFLLCTDPFAVTDVSLQLSVTSVLSLLTLSPVLNKSLARLHIPKFLRQSFSATVSVLLYTLPFMWLSFGQTALLSLLSNLVLIPLAQMAMIAALLMLLFTPLPYLVYACAVVVSGTTGGMLWLVEKLSALGAPILDLTGPLTCVAIAGVLLLFGVHFLLQRQRLGVTAAVACAFYLLTSFAGLAVEQGNAYLCIGSSSALLYDTHYALLVGTPDQSAYYAYTRILQNRRLQLLAVYLPDDRVGYYTRALTTAVHPVNVLLPGGNTALAVQPECEHLLTATAMDTTPWQGVQVQYRYNKKRYTVSITCKGKRLVLGNGTDMNGGDLTVAFGKQSTAVGTLVCARVLAEDELLTVTLRQDSALRIRRNDPWL